MRRIPLHSRKYPGLAALVDNADYKMLSQYRWHPCRATTVRVNFYAMTNTYIDGRRTTIKMHEMLVDCIRVDHIDGNGLNNQKHNLREATRSQNAANQFKREGTSSRFKGVTRTSSGTWSAQIRINGNTYHLGTFAREDEAACAYDNTAEEIFGEFARVNFPC